MGLDQKIIVQYDDELKYKYYYRKVNFLRRYMINTTTLDCDSNLDCVEVSIDNLHRLHKLCKEVLENHTKGPELLPTLSGFFYGKTDYDEYYYYDIEHLTSDLNDIFSYEEPQKAWYWDWW